MIITKNVSGGGWKTSTQKAETFAKKPFPPAAETQTQVFVYFRP